jgi:hypothetical protein
MARYYFDIKSKAFDIPDQEGTEFGCIWDAHFHAQKIIRKSHLYLEDGDYEDRWSVRIRNAEGGSEIIVLFPMRRLAMEKGIRAR